LVFLSRRKMFSKEFLSRLAKEAFVIFLVTLGTTILAGTGLSGAAATAGLIAGARAVVGVVVRNLGEFKDTPSL
jgi:hypothetical protein